MSVLDEDDDHAGSDLSSAYGEPEPEDALPDPESDLPSVPSVDVPSVDVPEPPSPDGEIPGELRRGFWTLVVVFNVAILAVAVGVLLLVFGDETLLGVGVLAVGLFYLGRGYLKYRRLAERQRAGAWSGGGEQSATDERNG